MEKRVIKGILVFLMLLILILSSSLSASAELYKKDNIVITGTDSYPANVYIGDYDVEATHEGLCAYMWKDEEKCKEYAQMVYQEMLSWGMTPDGAAAAIGNMWMESECDPSACESGATWESFWSKQGDKQYYFYGSKGIGLIQWTWYTIKFDLLNIAHDEGVQWHDMQSQIVCLRYIAGPNYKDIPAANGTDIKDTEDMGLFYKENPGTTYQGMSFSSEVDMLAYMWCVLIERPSVNNWQERGAAGKKALDEWGFRDLPAKSYDGSITKSKSKDKDDSSVSVDSYDIPDQWELEGMPKKSGIAEDLVVPTVVNRDNLTAEELNTVVQVKDDLSIKASFDLWTNVRIGFVFVGLLLIVYSLLMGLCLLFDVWNNFFNFSLVNFITLGSVHYSKAIDNPLDEGRYVGAKRVVVTICVLFSVGCLLVSGGVLPPLLRLIYRICSKFMI